MNKRRDQRGTPLMVEEEEVEEGRVGAAGRGEPSPPIDH